MCEGLGKEFEAVGAVIFAEGTRRLGKPCRKDHVHVAEKASRSYLPLATFALLLSPLPL
jgi:hypothetical protein